jgi:peptidyl-prolyl cis-trans isomerase C
MTMTWSQHERRGARILAIFALASASSCGHHGADLHEGPLPAGVVARVGGRDIVADDVARIAHAQRVPLGDARARAVRDVLLARGAEDRGLRASDEVKLAESAALARLVLGRLLETARATPPTAEELRAATERRWLDVDRPEGFRTVHAVVTFKAEDDDGKKRSARDLAAAIRASVQPLSERVATLSPVDGAPPTGPRIGPKDDPDPLSAAFRGIAAEVPVPAGLEVKVEPLPVISAEGRVFTPGDQRMDPSFAKGAAALAERGSLSGLVESSFGVHVIMLLERTPPQRLDGEARVARLRDDIVNERARAAQRALLADRKARSWVAPDAAGLLALVSVEP